MPHYHQYWLVLVSVLVAILASYTALTLALRIRVASRQVAPVVIDIGLPGLDGYHLAAQLRSTGLRTYLIALTGYGLAEDLSRAHDSGFDAHLTKPPPMDRLLALVASASG